MPVYAAFGHVTGVSLVGFFRFGVDYIFHSSLILHLFNAKNNRYITDKNADLSKYISTFREVFHLAQSELRGYT